MVPNVWALVVTAKASRLDLAKFCSFHLDQGAERIFLYLEDSDARTADILSSIPQIELTVTDETYWKIATGPPQSKIGKAKMHSMPIDVSKVSFLISNGWVILISTNSFTQKKGSN